MAVAFLKEHSLRRILADHPMIPSIPETEYLKGFLFEVI